MSASRTELRLMQGDAAILSPEEAVRQLPWRDASARAWLRANGFVHEETFPDGTSSEYVLWEDVRKALRAKSLRDSARAPKARGKVVPLKRIEL